MTFWICLLIGLSACDYPSLPPENCDTRDPDCRYEYEDGYRSRGERERGDRSYGVEYSDEAIDYFLEIAFGAEYGNIFTTPVVKKWNEDIRIQLNKDYTRDDEKEVEDVAEELSELTGLNIDVKDSRANLEIHFIDPDEEKKKLGALSRLLPKNLPSGLVVPYPSENFIYYKAVIFINKNMSGKRRRSVIREEMTQALGLLRDSYAYPDSIFHHNSSPIKFTDIDEEVIRILYDERVRPGMTRTQVRIVLQR